MNSDRFNLSSKTPSYQNSSRFILSCIISERAQIFSFKWRIRILALTLPTPTNVMHHGCIIDRTRTQGFVKQGHVLSMGHFMGMEHVFKHTTNLRHHHKESMMLSIPIQRPCSQAPLRSIFQFLQGPTCSHPPLLRTASAPGLKVSFLQPLKNQAHQSGSQARLL